MTFSRSMHARGWGVGTIAFSLITLTGCANGDTDGGSSDNTIRVQVEASKLAGFEAVAEMFEEDTGNNVIYETITSDQKATTNGQILASQDAPDLGLAPINAASYSQLLNGGAIQPLNDVWDSAELWDRYDEETVNSLVSGETPYSVVFENQFYNLVYFNSDLFAELGLEYESGHQMESSEELYSIVETLQADDRQGLCVGGTSGYQLGWLFDGQLASATDPQQLSEYLASGNPDSAEVDYETAEVVSALEIIEEWQDNGVFQAGALGQDYDTALANFVAETCGMLLGTATTVSALEDNDAAFDSEWMLLPGVGDPTLPAVYAGSTLVIPTSAQNPELAKEFLQFLLSEEAQTEYVSANGTLPAVTDISNETLEELLPAQVASVLAFNQDNGSAAGWTSVVPGEFGQGFIDPAIQEFLGSSQTAEQTAAALQQQYENFQPTTGDGAE